MCYYRGAPSCKQARVSSDRAAYTGSYHTSYQARAPEQAPLFIQGSTRTALNVGPQYGWRLASFGHHEPT